jgi:cell wall-associated NlpC family hydrolase
MYPERNVFLKVFLLFVVFLLLAACAPKKVRLYGVTDGIRGGVVASALMLQGKPYKNGSRGPDFFDCSGLVYYVFKQQRVLLPPPAEAQGRAGYEINRDSMQPGDLVIFKIEDGFHIGIMVSGAEFVHASKSRGVVIDGIDTDYWRKHLIGYRSVL